MNKSIVLSVLLVAILSLTFSCGQYADFPAPRDGDDGHNSLISLVSSAPGCANNGLTVLSGLDTNDDGNLGPTEVQYATEVCNGLNGNDGQDGEDGEDGEDGQNAPPTSYTVTAILDPCGPSGGHDEVLLKMANNTLIASFSSNGSALTTRFSILKPGTNYRTTDTDNCYFSVDSNGNLYNEHH